VCLHRGGQRILWKARRLARNHAESAAPAASSFVIATVGNYEYGFYWYFYQDGSIELEGEDEPASISNGPSRPG